MGTTHRAHTAVSINGPVLYDGCERCDEQSKNLFDLDNAHLKMIGQIVLGERRGISINDNRAAHHLRLAKQVVERANVI